MLMTIVVSFMVLLLSLPWHHAFHAFYCSFFLSVLIRFGLDGNPVLYQNLLLVLLVLALLPTLLCLRKSCCLYSCVSGHGYSCCPLWYFGLSLSYWLLWMVPFCCAGCMVSSVLCDFHWLLLLGLLLSMVPLRWLCLVWLLVVSPFLLLCLLLSSVCWFLCVWYGSLVIFWFVLSMVFMASAGDWVY